MIVTVHELDRDRRTCRVHDKRDAHRVLTYTRACAHSLMRALCDEVEVDVTIDRGEIVRADVVIGAVRP